MSDGMLPQWWAEAWTVMLARYPGCSVMAASGVVYYQDLSRFPPGVVLEGLDRARRESPTFFPSSQVVEACCVAIRERQQEQQGTRRALEAGRRNAAEEREHGRWLASAAGFCLAKGLTRELSQIDDRSPDDLLALARAHGWQVPPPPGEAGGRSRGEGLAGVIGNVIAKAGG